jgi:hypothetical protein
MNILSVAKSIQNKLNIENDMIVDIINEKFENIKYIKINDELSTKINLLLNIDDQISKFEKKIINKNTKDNFKIMKNSLYELQIYTLLNALNNSQSCDDVMNSFINILSEKFKTVNSILHTSLLNNQKGGGDKNSIINNYHKYCKYKLKNKKILNLI